MFKRVIILVALSSILLALLLVGGQTATPVNNINNKTVLEYTITKIDGDQYYGKSEDGTEIRFSDENILSGDKIQVQDEVIVYLERNSLGKTVVKVEKK
ncbi:hypothetical protein R4Z10_08110 [Niallia sp. XMNu-256]|uniref:hypothetical protein n=1 Tax=Niallia sp. XMNu-256 TaxID=3082444 RepID=UPI0030CFC2F8